MPETYGLPEDLAEASTAELVKATVEEAVAGSGIVRTTALYCAIAVLAITPLAALAIVPLLLLMVSDKRFTGA